VNALAIERWRATDARDQAENLDAHARNTLHERTLHERPHLVLRRSRAAASSPAPDRSPSEAHNARDVVRLQRATRRSRPRAVAAQVRQSVRRIAVALPSAFGLADVFAKLAARLGALTLTA
jgi:hypothetical protein